jgi:hypothetical protein
VLLTNYVMLELMVTRPEERIFLEQALASLRPGVFMLLANAMRRLLPSRIKSITQTLPLQTLPRTGVMKAGVRAFQIGGPCMPWSRAPR